MDQSEIFDQLLVLGRAQAFTKINGVVGGGIHASVVKFCSYLRGEGLKRFEALSNPDQQVFLKAVAVYEDTVEGVGSVTALERLLPIVNDDGHQTLDWILSHTAAYAYYAWGAASYVELEQIKRRAAERRRRILKEEEDRRLLAVAVRAERATGKLLNAVRRGDQKAVEALLSKGASQDVKGPTGDSLIQFAETCGHQAIAEILREHDVTSRKIQSTNDPVDPEKRI